MGKRKSKRRVKNESSIEDTNSVDETGSVDETISNTTNGDEESITQQDTWSDELLEAIDKLSEKKKATRLSALKTIHPILSKHSCLDYIERYTETLTKNLCSIFQRGTEEECIYAARVLDVLIINIGALSFSEDFVNKVLYQLTELGRSSNVKQDAGDAPKRAACISALTMWMFIVQEPEMLSLKGGSMDLVQKYFWKDKEPQVVVEGVKGWTLLATACARSTQVNLLPRVKKDLVQMLEHKSLDVRCAAGEALALLYESLLIEEEEDDSIYEIIDKVKQLSSESTKSKSKKERQAQHRVFRNILSTLEVVFNDKYEYNTVQSGDVPSEKVEICKTEIQLESWVKLVRYDRFKQRLGSGIMNHFKYNELVRDIFEVSHISFDTVERQKLSKIEKRALYSKKSLSSKLDTIQKSKKTRQRVARMLEEEY